MHEANLRLDNTVVHIGADLLDYYVVIGDCSRWLSTGCVSLKDPWLIVRDQVLRAPMRTCWSCDWNRASAMWTLLDPIL